MPVSEIRRRLRTAGVDTTTIPEIAFVGRSLAEVWTYADTQHALVARLRACGISVEEFDPLVGSGSVTTGRVAANAVSDPTQDAKVTFGCRMAYLTATCKSTDVRAAAAELIEGLPEVARAKAVWTPRLIVKQRRVAVPRAPDVPTAPSHPAASEVETPTSDAGAPPRIGEETQDADADMPSADAEASPGADSACPLNG